MFGEDELSKLIPGFLKEFHAGQMKSGEPEASLSQSFVAFLRALDPDIDPVPEPHLVEISVVPDFAVHVKNMLTGYVELKSPSTSIDPQQWKRNSHNGIQWAKLSLLPNLLLCNGTHISLWNHGERHGEVCDLTLAADPKNADASRLNSILKRFLSWSPLIPSRPEELSRLVAHYTRLLREHVLEVLSKSSPGLESLLSDWRTYFFPEATEERFADGFAQAITFALLLARAEKIDISNQPLNVIGGAISSHHSLMGQALKILADPELSTDLKFSLDLIQRVIAAVSWDELLTSPGSTGKTPWLYFYETFLEAYDPKLRKETGSYYTPFQVVEAMVDLTSELLRSEFHLPDGFASPEVTVLDPACGTGTFLITILETVYREQSLSKGEGLASDRIKDLVNRLIGFEIQLGPYAVAELQIAAASNRLGNSTNSASLYLANTLEDPYAPEISVPGLYRQIGQSRTKANEIKRQTKVKVVIGNPPYGDKALGKGGFIELSYLKEGSNLNQSLLDSFRGQGLGKFEYVLSNLYVYFWRWSLWKVFEQGEGSQEGIASLITPSSWISGKGFTGMRTYFVNSADKIFLIDLGGDQRSAIKDEGIFSIKIPVAVAILVKLPRDPELENPIPEIKYLRISGSREEKLSRLGTVNLDDDWLPFPVDDFIIGRLPAIGTDQWNKWPDTAQILDEYSPGVKPQRTWIISPSKDVLLKRWRRLIDAPTIEKTELHKKTRDRSINRIVNQLHGMPTIERPLVKETIELAPEIVEYGFRSFDTQYIIGDNRVIDRPRPMLWKVRGVPNQVFLNEMHVRPLSVGPAATFCQSIPDMNYFLGHDGGRVFPCFKEDGSPNTTENVLMLLNDRLGVELSGEDIFNYLAAVLGGRPYSMLFEEQLKQPGSRIPITTDRELFQRTVEFGEKVLSLHLQKESIITGNDSESIPMVVEPVKETFPESISWDEKSQSLLFGTGRISNVTKEVWEYSVSGMQVIRKWFSYRKKNPAYLHSSPLNDILPESWEIEWTENLLNLVRSITQLVALEEEQAELLLEIVSSDTLVIDDFPANDQKKINPRFVASGNLFN